MRLDLLSGTLIRKDSSSGFPRDCARAALEIAHGTDHGNSCRTAHKTSRRAIDGTTSEILHGIAHETSHGTAHFPLDVAFPS